MNNTNLVIRPTVYLPDGGIVSLTRFADNDAICIVITTPAGAIAARASVNVDTPLDRFQTVIKDWSENEGVLQALIDAGAVVSTGLTVPCGYVDGEVCNLTDALIPFLPPVEEKRKWA